MVAVGGLRHSRQDADEAMPVVRRLFSRRCERTQCSARPSVGRRHSRQQKQRRRRWQLEDWQYSRGRRDFAGRNPERRNSQTGAINRWAAASTSAVRHIAHSTRYAGADGASVSRSKSFATRKGAAAFLARKTVETEDGFGDPSERSVAAFLSDWISHLEVRDQLSPATLNHYRRLSLVLSSMIGAKKLVKLMPEDLTRCYDRLITGRQPAAKRPDGTPKEVKPWSVATVRAFHGFARTAFESARKARLIRGNPADDADRSDTGCRRSLMAPKAFAPSLMRRSNGCSPPPATTSIPEWTRS